MSTQNKTASKASGAPNAQDNILAVHINRLDKITIHRFKTLLVTYQNPKLRNNRVPHLRMQIRISWKIHNIHTRQDKSNCRTLFIGDAVINCEIHRGLLVHKYVHKQSYNGATVDPLNKYSQLLFNLKAYVLSSPTLGKLILLIIVT